MIRCVAALAALVLSGNPDTWVVETGSQFQSGTIEQVSVLGTGEVTLAPLFDKLFDAPDPYLWSVALDRAGNVYAGSGNDAKVFKIDKEGKSSLIFDGAELQAQALAWGPDGALYVGTNPKGKIWRIPEGGTAKVFFDPGEEYIWALLFDAAGNLYAGTGRNGKLYRITPEGNGEVWLDSEETHVRALAFRPDGKLLAGTDPNGFVLEVSGAGRAFVLYDSPVREVAALACDGQGNVYAAGLDTRPGTPGPPPPMQVPTPTPQPPPQPQAGEPEEETKADEGGPPRPAPSVSPPREDAMGPGPKKGRGELYRLAPDGVVRAVWKSSSDLIYALLVHKDGRVLIGTGDRGGLYAVEDEGKSRLLVKTTQAQVTALVQAEGGEVFVTTSNLGKLFRLSRDHAREGSLVSEVKDARLSSDWGRLRFRGEIPEGTSLRLLTRSGNTDKPDKTWSEWAQAAAGPEGGNIPSPRARFLQWKAVLATTRPAATPRLQGVTVYYLQRNAGPVITSVTIPKDGGGRTPQPMSGPPGTPASAAATAGARRGAPGALTVQWTSEDPNGDSLVYRLDYKGVSDRNWKPLKEDLKGTSHALDTRALPDGTYLFRVTASDEPSNPKERSLTGERVSDPVEVDNTPPETTELKAAVEGARAVVSFALRDRVSAVRKVEYSLDAKEWEVLFPVDGISDSKSEDYALTLNGLEPGEHSVVVRFSDEADNQGTARAVFVVEKK